MARYENLPIYKSVYDLVLYLYSIVPHFGRQHKYGIGKDVLDLSRRISRKIVSANSSYHKKPILEDVRLDLEEMKLLIRICKDLKAFNNFNSFETAINKVVEISRQNEGWLKSQAKQRSESSKDAHGYDDERTE